MSKSNVPIIPLLHTINNDTIIGRGTMGTLVLAFGALFLMWYLQWHWRRRFLYFAASKVNGPKWLPFIGSALMFAGSTEDILKKCVKLCTEYQTPARVWLAHRLFFVISEPEDLEIVLNSPKALEKDDLYKYSVPLLGKGIFSSPVSKWKKHRKAIAPTLNQKILDLFVGIFSEQAEVLVKCLKEDVGKQCDIGERFNRLALDSICESALEEKMNIQTTDSNYGHNIDRLSNIMFTRMFQIWYHSDFIFSLTSMCNEEKRAVSEIHQFTEEIVKQKKENYMLRKEENDNVIVEDSEFKRKPFLDLLIDLSEKGANFTDTDLRDETNTLILAGSDTTATVESFITVCLGLYPEIQDKVYKEVMDLIGPDRPVEKDDLPELKYLERVIKETMRFFPIGPAIVRKVTEDLHLHNNVLAPTDSGIVLVIYKVHFDPKHWTDSWSFDPDRFLPEVAAKRHPYAYLPFSAGPRNCIGLKYAMMAMKVTIATLIRKYRFFTDYKSIKDVKVRQDLIIKPVDGYKVRVEDRI